jgi:hypothetical protein
VHTIECADELIHIEHDDNAHKMRLADYLQEGLQTNDSGAMKLAAHALGATDHRARATVSGARPRSHHSLSLSRCVIVMDQVGWRRQVAR